MLPASNRGDGEAIATPDTCMTPDGTGGSQPIPYTNTAMNTSATDFAENVMIAMMNALNIATTIPQSSGDEEGTNSEIEGEVMFTTGSPVVYVEGSPAVTLTTPTEQNDGNAVGTVSVPSTSNVQFCHLAADPSPGRGLDRYRRRLGRADLDLLHDALYRGRTLTAALLDGGVGHLTVSLLSPDLPPQLHAAIRRLADGGMRALVLDLRGCAGGDLDAAVEVAGAFLPRGAVVARVVDADGDATPHAARGASPLAWPLVLLVDGRTASAAELVTGSLQAHDRAVVVGERTYGKGSVQALLPAVDGLVSATVAQVVLPGDAPIEGAGVTPDLESAPGEGDPQLDAACIIALGL